ERAAAVRPQRRACTGVRGPWNDGGAVAEVAEWRGPWLWSLLHLQSNWEHQKLAGRRWSAPGPTPRDRSTRCTLTVATGAADGTPYEGHDPHRSPGGRDAGVSPAGAVPRRAAADHPPRGAGLPV